mmetsp:Transcript_3102/g.6929  ORF Transcript_3102/g.6929 Transcript_3102/m.6929 type:complete len:94 (+) Transcript_3102:2427-2708(+)
MGASRKKVYIIGTKMCVCMHACTEIHGVQHTGSRTSDHATTSSIPPSERRFSRLLPSHEVLIWTGQKLAYLSVENKRTSSFQNVRLLRALMVS